MPRVVTVSSPVSVGRIDFESIHAYTIDGSAVNPETILTRLASGEDMPE